VTVTRVKAVKGGEKKINPLTKTEYITKDKPAPTLTTHHSGPLTQRLLERLDRVDADLCAPACPW